MFHINWYKKVTERQTGPGKKEKVEEMNQLTGEMVRVKIIINGNLNITCLCVAI